jgi:hypothetical protein
MFSAATKTAAGGDGGTQFYVRALVTAGTAAVTVPAETQPNDLLIYVERGIGVVSIATGFSMAVSVSLPNRGASISYKTATTADAGSVINGMGGVGLSKFLGVFYTNTLSPVYALVSAAGQITNSKPANIVLTPVSVSGAALVLGAYAQTLGTSATRTFVPTQTTTVFVGPIENRILLNAESTCSIEMNDEGDLNTLMGVFFSVSED